jgi:hypothetical protein
MVEQGESFFFLPCVVLVSMIYVSAVEDSMTGVVGGFQDDDDDGSAHFTDCCRSSKHVTSSFPRTK